VRLFAIILFFLVVCFYSYGQEPSENAFSKWSVTVKPIGFLDPFLTNFTLGGQHRVSEKFLVEINGGLIQSWYCTYNQKEDNISKSGWRAGAEVKYLFHRKLYIAAQAFHNNYIKTNNETVWRYNRAYTQDFELEKHITATGGHLKFGILIHHPGKPLFFDFYAGLGMRYRDTNIRNLPDDGEIVEDIDWFGPRIFNFDTDVTGSKTTPSVALGFSVGWQFGKKP
jgi:hypothetical protein